jgi:hypothetical protein
MNLQLFHTFDRGWGVRTRVDIKERTYVCEYIGEIIDEEVDHLIPMIWPYHHCH